MPLRKRLAAIGALVAGAAAVALAAGEAVRNFPRGAILLACVAAALWLAVHAITRRGVRRVVGLALATLLLAMAVAVLVSREPVAVALATAAAATSVACARAAFRMRVELPAAPRPSRPVLFCNPRSGGGKAARFRLPDEARARGIKPVLFGPGDDLVQLVRDEVAAGADALAVAGGDGSQAAVAAIAAESGLPYACVPAGTRNHFALDLGVDRGDVVGALDALVDGGERVVDLADVNGRLFVNNVSLGLYATAVHRPGYREARIRTLLDTVPDVAGPVPHDARLEWHGPDGAEHGAGIVMLVSNNRYRLGPAVGSGSRPRLDGGELGVAVFGGSAPDERGGLREWATPSLEVDAPDGSPIPAGIDGEAVLLQPPLVFRVRPRALRVRIARTHPGASPSAMRPSDAGPAVVALARIAFGRGGGAGSPRPGDSGCVRGTGTSDHGTPSGTGA
jgi:diacylglycerol kinase family enzyme